MPIISSIITEDRVQIDGRRKIIEAHTDHLNIIHYRNYIADNNFIPNLTESADIINNILIQTEIDNNVDEIESGNP